MTWEEGYIRHNNIDIAKYWVNRAKGKVKLALRELGSVILIADQEEILDKSFPGKLVRLGVDEKTADLVASVLRRILEKE